MTQHIQLDIIAHWNIHLRNTHHCNSLAISNHNFIRLIKSIAFKNLQIIACEKIFVWPYQCNRWHFHVNKIGSFYHAVSIFKCLLLIPGKNKIYILLCTHWIVNTLKMCLPENLWSGNHLICIRAKPNKRSDWTFFAHTWGRIEIWVFTKNKRKKRHGTGAQEHCHWN